MRLGCMAKFLGVLTAFGFCVILGALFGLFGSGFSFLALVGGMVIGGFVMYKAAASGPPVNSSERRRLIVRTVAASVAIFVRIPLAVALAISVICLGTLQSR
jgi:hypothetical protein